MLFGTPRLRNDASVNRSTGIVVATAAAATTPTTTGGLVGGVLESFTTHPHVAAKTNHRVTGAEQYARRGQGKEEDGFHGAK